MTTGARELGVKLHEHDMEARRTSAIMVASVWPSMNGRCTMPLYHNKREAGPIGHAQNC
jgi:hypothetical protein